MTEQTEERLLVAFEKLASAMMMLAKIELERFNKRYPAKGTRPAEISREGDDKKELFNDKGTSQWFEETEAREPKEPEPSRFQKRFDESSKTVGTAKRSGTETARGKSRIIRSNSKD